MLDIIKQHLYEQQEKWLDILNSHYKSDSGTPYEDYARGRLKAYTELLAFITTQEKQDENPRTREAQS